MRGQAYAYAKTPDVHLQYLGDHDLVTRVLSDVVSIFLLVGCWSPACDMLTARFPSRVRSLNRTFGEVSAGAGSSSGISRTLGWDVMVMLPNVREVYYSVSALLSASGWDWASPEGVGFRVVGGSWNVGGTPLPDLSIGGLKFRGDGSYVHRQSCQGKAAGVTIG